MGSDPSAKPKLEILKEKEKIEFSNHLSVNAFGSTRGLLKYIEEKYGKKLDEDQLMVLMNQLGFVYERVTQNKSIWTKKSKS